MGAHVERIGKHCPKPGSGRMEEGDLLYVYNFVCLQFNLHVIMYRISRGGHADGLSQISEEQRIVQDVLRIPILIQRPNMETGSTAFYKQELFLSLE